MGCKPKSGKRLPSGTAASHHPSDLLAGLLLQVPFKRFQKLQQFLRVIVSKGLLRLTWLVLTEPN